jgi:hypothetical protein
MSTATTTIPDDERSYYERALKSIVQEPSCEDKLRAEANDCLTCMNPTSKHDQKAKSKSRLIRQHFDILADGEKSYTKYCPLIMAARTLSRAANPAEQSVLHKHGFDYQNGYRLSGESSKDGSLRDSTFASKKDNGYYRLLHFNSSGGPEEKVVSELGLRSRLGLAETVKEREIRRMACGTSGSNIDGATAWAQRQEGASYTHDQDDIRSIRQGVADIRGVLGLPGSSVGGRNTVDAKKRLWKSKYNHPKLRGDYPRKGQPHGAMEMLCSRLAAEIVLSRDPESDTVKNLNSRYSDLSQAILVDCQVNESGSFNENDLDITRSSFFFPADPETSQSIDPFDQFYDLVSVEGGKIVSIVEHSVGEVIGKLGVVSNAVKTGSSKRRGDKPDEGDEAGPSSGTKKPRVMG